MAERNHLVDALDSLPAAVRTVRSARGLSLREAAAEIGIGVNTLYRLERGISDIRVSNVRAALLWVANPDDERRERAIEEVEALINCYPEPCVRQASTDIVDAVLAVVGDDAAERLEAEAAEFDRLGDTDAADRIRMSVQIVRGELSFLPSTA